MGKTFARSIPVMVLAVLAGGLPLPSASIDAAPFVPWPMLGHDARHSSRTFLLGPQNAHLAWQFTEAPYPGFSHLSSPVVGSDGTIYVTKEFRRLLAIYPTGSVRWSAQFDDSVSESTPAIGADGTIYVGGLYSRLGDRHGTVYALNADGTVRWNFRTDEKVSSPTIGLDGTVYVATRGKRIYAIWPDGTLKWRFPDCGDDPPTACSIQVDGTPAIGADGAVYFTEAGARDSEGGPDNPGYLYALNPDGTFRWRSFLGIVRRSPLLSDRTT